QRRHDAAKKHGQVPPTEFPDAPTLRSRAPLEQKAPVNDKTCPPPCARVCEAGTMRHRPSPGSRPAMPSKVILDLLCCYEQDFESRPAVFAELCRRLQLEPGGLDEDDLL